MITIYGKYEVESGWDFFDDYPYKDMWWDAIIEVPRLQWQAYKDTRALLTSLVKPIVELAEAEGVKQGEV